MHRSVYCTLSATKGAGRWLHLYQIALVEHLFKILWSISEFSAQRFAPVVNESGETKLTVKLF